MASETSQRIDYAFKRDFRSSIRLNYNHWLMKELTGYLIHPAIQADSPNLRIADLGTGTNIWASEVAARFPDTVRIDGFDISGDQFAPMTCCPSNLHLHVQDCFKPFSAESVGSFDLVHARFLACVVNNLNAPALLKNMVTLLKPGGYLQWFEALNLSVRAVHPSVDDSSTAVDQLVSYWQKPSENNSNDWIEKLPQLYSEQGLEVVAADRFSLPQYLRHPWCQSLLAGMEDRAEIHTSKENEHALDQKRWMLGLMKAFANGSYLDVPFICVVGKKLVE